MSRIFRTDSDESTVQLGIELGKQWTPPKTVLLIGNLGSGKTTLAKGISEGAGATVRDDVSSPTFPLIHEYGDPAGVYHIDLYRLDTLQQVATLGLDDILDRNAIVLMEWAERFPQLLPQVRTEIRITTLPDGTREFDIREIS